MKKLILVVAPPACGKNYVSELICKALGNISYFDKDDLSVLLRRSFALCEEAINMDGQFYLENLRSAEYTTLFDLAFSALRFSNFVLVNAPLLKERLGHADLCALAALDAFGAVKYVVTGISVLAAICEIQAATVSLPGNVKSARG